MTAASKERWQLLLGLLPCEVLRSSLLSPSAVLRLRRSGMCWTWSSSQNSPCVFRQAAWAMAWLPCRLKEDLTGHLGKTGEYPFCTDCWQPAFHSPSKLHQICWSFEHCLHNLIFVAEVLHANCISRALPRPRAGVWGGKHFLRSWTSGLCSAMDLKCPVSPLLHYFKLMGNRMNVFLMLFTDSITKAGGIQWLLAYGPLHSVFKTHRDHCCMLQPSF